MKILLTILAILTLGTFNIAHAAPQNTYTRNFLPEVTNLYDLGTSTNIFNRIFGRYASTTSLSTQVASSTFYYGAGFTACNATTEKLLWAAGQFSCGTDNSGSGGSAYPFTPTLNYAVLNQATTGIPWFQNGLNASSTSHFVYASTTALNARSLCLDTDTCRTTWPTGTVTSVGLSSTNSTLTIGSSPVTTSGTITADFNLSNPNIWTGLQTFKSASSTSFSSLDGLFVGRTATTTIRGDLGTSTFSSFISAIAASTTATSTMKGINMPYGGCYAINGTCIGGSSGSGTVSSGLAGQLGYYNTSGTTISGTSTNPLYVDAIVGTSTTLVNSFASSVGIGTTSPYARLSIEQTGAEGYLFAIGDQGTSSPLFVATGGLRLGIGVASPTGFIQAVGIPFPDVTGSTGSSGATTGTISLTATVGGATTIATTGTGGAGGRMNLVGGAGGVANSAVTSATGGVGGQIQILSGAGGAPAVSGGAVSRGGVGGGLLLNSGAGGVPTLATILRGNNGGVLQITSGSGSNSSGTGNTFAGGNGGNMTFTSGSGGTSDSTSAAGGNGANLAYITGGGGANAAFTGGDAGTLSYLTANGGAGVTGGNGGPLTQTIGNGGTGTTGNGGIGGSNTITAGNGGASSGGGNGGAAGDFKFTAGNAGTGGTQPAGGSFYLLPGTGSPSGNVVLNSSSAGVFRGNTGIATTTPAWQLQVASTSASATFRPQFALTDNSAGTDLKHWTMQSRNGFFYLATSTDLYATSTVPAITVTPQGNVGIATSSPGSQFAIGNIANFSTGTSTFSSTGGINIANGCFSIAGVCVGGGGAASQWTTSGSNIYYSTGYVGIGTTTPQWPLTIASTTAAQLSLSSGAGVNQWAFRNDNAGNLTISTTTVQGNATSSSAAFQINSTGLPSLQIGSQPIFQVSTDGHRFASSTAPTVSSGAIDGTDAGGRVVGCTSACTITFASAYARIPSCIVQVETGSVVNTVSYTPTTASLVVTETGLGTFNFICLGR